jgi:hypothetical protein
VLVEARFVALQGPALIGINGLTLSKDRKIQMAAHAREQQRANMQLQNEFARQNECAQFTRRYELEFNAVVQGIASVV